MSDNVTLEKEEIEVIEKVKPYTLRKVKSSDLFLMIAILGKIGFTEFKDVFRGKSIANLKRDENGNVIADENLADILLPAVDILLNHLCLVENELYKFLSALSNISVKDLKDLSINIFIDMIIDVLKKEEFVDFFNLAAKYIK